MYYTYKYGKYYEARQWLHGVTAPPTASAAIPGPAVASNEQQHAFAVFYAESDWDDTQAALRDWMAQC